MTVTVELRDSSENAVSEIRGLVWRYGGHVVSVNGHMVTVEALTPKALETLFAALEADPRVISFAERDTAERTARYVEHLGAVEADRVAELESTVALQHKRIIELEGAAKRVSR